MERKVWRRPLTEVQKFEANEYVAACGESGTTYKFVCNASGWFDLGGIVIDDTNGNGVFDGLGTDHVRSTYTPCSETHIAESTDDFSVGFLWALGSLRDPKKVIIWGGPDGKNTHCTTELDMSKWETAKS